MRGLLTIAAAFALALAAACGGEAQGLSDASIVRDAATHDAAAPDASALDVTVHPFGLTTALALNLAPNEVCELEEETDRPEAFVTTGSYDLSQSAERGCHAGYTMMVLLRARQDPAAQGETRAGAQRLTLQNAQITLQSATGVPIVFEEGGDTLPNPLFADVNASLALPATGEWAHLLAPIEAIPIFHAPMLRTLGADRIVAKITVTVSTLQGEGFELGPFLYPIDLCEGCLIKCASTLMASGTTREEALAGACADEVGADGRICIDDDC